MNKSNKLAIEEKVLRHLSVERLLNVSNWDKSLIVFSLIIAFICYGYDIFGFSLRIDSEFHAGNSGAKLAWVSQGRWVMYYLNLWLLPDAVMPVIPPLISVLGLVLGSLLFVASLSGNKGIHSYLAIALLVTCPVYYFVHYFTTLGYGVGVGYTLAGLGTYILIKKNPGFLWLVVICYTLAIGIYQAFLPVLAVMFGISLIDAFIESKSDLKLFFIKSISFLCVLIVAYGLYEFTKNWMIAYWDTSFDKAYISGFNKFELSQAYLEKVIPNSFNHLLMYYQGDESIYLYKLLVLKYLFVIALFGLALRVLFHQKSLFGGMLVVILALLVLLAPMSLLIMNGGVMPPRTQLAIPVIIAGMFYLAAKTPSVTFRGVLVVLAVACVYKFSVTVNRYSFASDMQWQADKAFASELIGGLASVTDQLPAKSYHDAYPIEIVGVRYLRDTPILTNREVIGTSFFQWGAGDSYRIIGLMRSMGFYDFKVADVDQRVSVIEEAKKMPSWPLPGYVKVINGVAVVKVNDYNPNQLYRICAGKKELRQCAGYN